MPSNSGPDQQTYRRSANSALLGLGVQLFLLVFVGLVSLFAGSAAISLLTYYLFGGTFIWIGLWLLHNQHRLERQETLEAQALAASDQTAATIFDEAGDQLALARARLNNLYKVGLPAVSLVLAVFLLGLGLYRFIGLYRLISFQTADGIDTSRLGDLTLGADAQPYALPLAGVLVGLAFFAFVVARYIAGMTKTDHWSTLRGGAAFLMGNFAAIALVGVSLALYSADYRLPLTLAPLIIAAGMVLLGLEIVTSFVFGAYRPRRQGEVPRIAFDSRLLGWLVRPESLGSVVSETINYQFGLEISKTWFYQLIGRALVPMIALCVTLLVALSAVVVVDPAQMAVLTHRGQVDRVVGPGLHLKLPWPLGSAEKYDVTRLQTIAVGSETQYTDGLQAVLWTNQHADDSDREGFLLTAPMQTGNDATRGPISADLAGGRVQVNYRIAGDNDEETEANLRRYVNSAVSPERVLRSIVEREVMLYFATHDIDHLLSRGRAEIADPETGLRPRIQAAADTFGRDEAAGIEGGLGLYVVHVSLTSVHPPQDDDVAASFQSQINVEYEADTRIAAARMEQTQQLSAAAGSVTAGKQLYDRIVRLDRRADRVTPDGSGDADALPEDLEAERVAILR